MLVYQINDPRTLKFRWSSTLRVDRAKNISRDGEESFFRVLKKGGQHLSLDYKGVQKSTSWFCIKKEHPLAAFYCVLPPCCKLMKKGCQRKYIQTPCHCTCRFDLAKDIYHFYCIIALMRVKIWHWQWLPKKAEHL